jgi:glucose/arabinose dehydrogenase
VRIRTDGSVPEDNPFVATPGARPEIWSYGHRNPQGLVFDRATGQLWSDEHGPQGGDELNLIHAAAITVGPSPPSASTMLAVRSR